MVVLTSNVCQQAGLCNGSVRVANDIVDDLENAPPPGLPKCVWVDFHNEYTIEGIVLLNVMCERAKKPIASSELLMSSGTVDVRHFCVDLFCLSDPEGRDMCNF